MGLAAAAATEDTAGVEGVVAVGEAAEVAEGVMGVVGTWEEPSRLAAEVEVGVTAVDGLWMEMFSKTLCKITFFAIFAQQKEYFSFFVSVCLKANDERPLSFNSYRCYRLSCLITCRIIHLVSKIT